MKKTNKTKRQKTRQILKSIAGKHYIPKISSELNYTLLEELDNDNSRKERKPRREKDWDDD